MMDGNDVYLGTYESVKETTFLMDKSHLGLLVMDECHSVLLEESFRESISVVLPHAHLNQFERILMMSATLTSSMSDDVFKKLKIDCRERYENYITSLPHSGRIFITSKVFKIFFCNVYCIHIFD